MTRHRRGRGCGEWSTELPDCQVVGEADTGRGALQGCIDHTPNVVLLDIRMPDMDGIEAARHIAEIDAGPAVVFTTAYDHYAIDAFDAHAVGYLLKPIRRERLEKALTFASRLGRAELGEISRETARTNVCVRRGAELRLIPVEEIRYFHADQKYVTVHHAGGEDLLDEALKDLADEFADYFIRIHRSHADRAAVSRAHGSQGIRSVRSSPARCRNAAAGQPASCDGGEDVSEA